VADEDTTKFFEIADSLVAEEANEFLDQRMAVVERWCQFRISRGEPADLRSLIEQLMQEPNMKGPVVVCLAAAMWRLRGKENSDG
jgi:hypothetical protein